MIDIEAAYQQALDYLYSFVDYSLTRNLLVAIRPTTAIYR